MTLRRWLLRASGPARLRADLRGMTRPVRRYRERFGMLAAVHTQIPRAVMGDDLLDLLSKELRSAIEQEPQQRAAVVDERRTRSALLPPLANGQAHGFPALPATSPATRFAPTTDAASAPSNPAWLDATPPNAARDPFGPVPGAGQGARMEDIAHTRATGGTPPGAMHQGDVPARRAAAPDTALARSVRAYWRSEGATPPAANRAENGVPERDRQRQPVPSPDDPAAPAARAWPEQTANTLMERMASFVAGRAPSTASGTPTNGAGRTPEPAAPPPSVRRATWDTTASLDDLGEHMADILREQATQHGIDLV
jgi:hypothetical protein